MPTEESRQLCDALARVVPPSDTRLRVLTAALETGDAAFIEAAMAFIGRTLPPQKKAEVEIARRLRLAANDAPPIWILQVDLGARTVADINNNSPPAFTARHAYALEAPSSGIRVSFSGGARCADPGTVARAMHGFAGTLPHHRASEEAERSALLASATTERKG